ncbi:MAG: diacylglycerol/lipid kinase family protein, partial [Anaerolineales bacterium]
MTFPFAAPPEIRPCPPVRRVHIIANPAAGQAQPVLTDLNTTFKPAGIDWEIKLTNEAGDGARLAREAIAAGVDVVGVYGGDGTVMEVAQGLMGTSIPMAILPGGSANVLSADLQIPIDLKQAAALLVDGSSVVRQIDAGRVGDRVFLTRVGTGLEAAMIENTEREAKDRLGWMAYGLTLLRTLTDPPTAHYALTLDGREMTYEGLVCVVANSGLITPNTSLAEQMAVRLAPNISLSDGLLDVVVIRGTDLGSLLSAAASMVAGNEDAEPLLHWQVREVTLQSDPPQSVQCDGEIIGPTPVTVRIIPQAVGVVVPRTSITEKEVAPKLTETEI